MWLISARITSEKYEFLVRNYKEREKVCREKAIHFHIVSINLEIIVRDINNKKLFEFKPFIMNFC